MTRTRRQNKAAHTSAMYEFTINNRELVFVSWLLVQKEGLNREESRYVANIVATLDLDRDLRFEPKQLKEETTYELSGYELNWMKGRLDEIFKESRMPPNQAAAATSLDDYLNDILKGNDGSEEKADTEDSKED